MSEVKARARVRVRITVELDADGCWGNHSTVEEVYRPGTEAVKDALRRRPGARRG